MYLVLDRDDRVVARVKTRESAHKIARTARLMGRGALVLGPREQANLEGIFVLISGRKERRFDRFDKANEWARRHLKEKMAVGATASFRNVKKRSPHMILRLTERGVVVTRGAGIGNVVA